MAKVRIIAVYTVDSDAEFWYDKAEDNRWTIIEHYLVTKNLETEDQFSFIGSRRDLFVVLVGHTGLVEEIIVNEDDLAQARLKTMLRKLIQHETIPSKLEEIRNLSNSTLDSASWDKIVHQLQNLPPLEMPIGKSRISAKSKCYRFFSNGVTS